MTARKIAVMFLDTKKLCLKKEALKKIIPCHVAVANAVPIRQKTAERFEKTPLKPSKYCIFDLLKGISSFSEGKTLNATIKLIKDMGNKYPKKPIRHPHEPAMKPNIGEATR